MRSRLPKILQVSPKDSDLRVALVATSRLLLRVIVAIVIYELAARLLGPMVADDQKAAAWIDDNWWHAVVTLSLCAPAAIIGVRSSYSVVRQAMWPQPERTVRSAVLIAIAFLFSAFVFLPFLSIGLVLLSLIVYGASLLSMKSTGFGKRWRITSIIALICVAAALAYTLISYAKPSQHTASFVDTVWLPDPRAKNIKTLSLPTTATAELKLLYGQMLILHSTDVKTQHPPHAFPIDIYEGRANAWFNPAHCPNIAGIEEILPSACKQIGTVHNAKVYAISRSLPLGDYEVYTQFGSTAIYFDASPMTNEESVLQYLQTFRKVAANRVAVELQTNQHSVSALASELKRKHDTLAERLPFRTLLPSTLPQGWFLNSDTRIGPELDRPTIQEVRYSDGQGHSVGVIIVPQTGFSWQRGACGPVPYDYEHVSLNCFPVQNQNYYQAYKSIPYPHL